MKANQKAIQNDEEAVSPVIAVILMVAITVVLAATVFVLVNELGQNVGETGPTLGLTTASSADNQWVARITSATGIHPILEYTPVLTGPDGNACTLTAGDPPVSPFVGAGNDCHDFTWAHTPVGTATDLSVGDRLTIGAPGADTFDQGRWSLEMIHRPSGTSAGTLTRNF